MAMHLGNFLKSCREGRGWSLGQVARQLGYQNITKGARRVHLLEEGKANSPDILGRLLPILGIDPGKIEELLAQDRVAYLAGWERWANEPVPIQIVVKCIPGVFGTHAMPADLKKSDEIVAYAQGLARRLRKKVFVVLARRLTINVNEEGEITSRNVATPDNDARPAMRLGKKTFLLPFSPSGAPPQSEDQQ
jgi:transcriptional regulator with XRE-family HTH domain